MSPVSNRVNALRSTGPRTASGKARSRFNALKHGLDARESVIPGEDPEARSELSEAYREEHNPQGATQSYVVETLAQKHWERRRFLKTAAQVSRAVLAEQPDAGDDLGAALLKDPAGARLLDKVYRRLETSHRAWIKALADLRRLQQEQAGAESASEPVPSEPGLDPILTPDAVPAIDDDAPDPENR